MQMLLHYIRSIFDNFNDKSFQRLFKLFSFFCLIIIAYGFVFSGFQIIDEFEHLHASWLIFEGKAPYRDFFEHHNPLLWFLSAPIVGLFYDNVSIFYVMRFVSSLVSITTLFYLYKIASFWSNKTYSWLVIALYLGNIITIYNFYQFRPDNFMNMCFIIGIYYLFCYLKNLQIKNLIFSFLAFCFSALFLQKIVLLLIVLAFILLFLLYKKNILKSDFIIASFPAIFIAVIFVFYLFNQGIWEKYIELNLKFNLDVIYYYGRASFWLQSTFFSIYSLAFITSILFFKRENLYFKIISILYIAEFIMRNFYFAPHPNYYTLTTMLSALILPVWLKYYGFKYKPISAIICILMFLHLGQLFNTIERSSQRYNSYNHYNMTKYIHENTNKNDILINGYDKAFNIYRNDASYYWFNIEMLLHIFKYRYKTGFDYNINDLVIIHKPKFLYIKNYVDLASLRLYGEAKYIQQFNPTIINSLYKPTLFENLVILK